jgi:hypothetical protein
MFDVELTLRAPNLDPSHVRKLIDLPGAAVLYAKGETYNIAGKNYTRIFGALSIFSSKLVTGAPEDHLMYVENFVRENFERLEILRKCYAGEAWVRISIRVSDDNYYAFDIPKDFLLTILKFTEQVTVSVA